ncbi:tetratricopeptide repeat protein [Glaciimonas sp. PCH181]|uniref:tetratricopeptide repeat protein n=1 Tax=Glaciimonas sp. PCH181 TaxID=2133943 RepID=UPI000D386BDA|nr:tetratricopeptide repeat protein [Glaciimonas sp. PCH181]PUA17487.1 signal peptidase [Glaciimonas sp. PCH181]
MAIKRERLVHPFFIALFGALIAFTLGLMLPHERLVQRLKNAEGNALSVAYLEAWLRIKRDDLELVSVLARQYIQSGRLTEADPLVARLLTATDPTIRGNALLLEIQIAEQRAYALQPEDPQRIALLEKIGTMMTQAKTFTWEPVTLQNLAVKSRALNLLDLSAEFYRRLALVDPKHAGEWQMLAGELSLENSKYRDAANASFAAQAASTSLAEQRTYFLSGLRALQAGNLMQLAMSEAQEHAGPYLENDAETLRFLTNLARSANRPDLAEKYAKRLLSVMQTSAINAIDRMQMADTFVLMHASSDGSNPAADQPVYLDGVKGNALRKALDRDHPAGILRVAANATNSATPAPAQASPAVKKNTAPAAPVEKPKTDTPKSTQNDDFELTYNVFLSNQNLTEALRVAEAANRRTPGDPLWMRRRAMVNEWKGQAPQALQAWLDMAHATNSPEAWQAVLRLAPGLNNDAVYLEALRHQAGSARSELVLIDQIVGTYERLDQADKALAFLDAQMNKTAYRKELLERYAALAERTGDDDLALRSYLRLNREYGPQTPYALKLANIYSARGDFVAACDVLLAVQNKVDAADVFFWRALIQSAVRAERDDVAREASRHLVTSQQATPGDMENIISLWDEYPIDAARLAESSFRKTGNIVSLQEAVYQYSRARAWQRIDALLNSLTLEQTEAAEKSPEFLMAKAEFLRQTGRNDDALATLRTVIAVNDTAGDARAAFIWALTDRGTDIELRATLKRWRDDAENDSELWAPYAAGYTRLYDRANALHFLNKQGPEKLNDPLFALTYADALEELGQPDRAWQIRRRAWLEISKRRAVLLGTSPGSGKKPQQVASAGNTANDKDADDDSEVEISLQSVENQAEMRARSVTLAQTFAGGDFSRNLLTHVLRQNLADQASAPGGQTFSIQGLGLATDDIKIGPAKAPVYSEAVAEDVALTWSLSNEPYELARAWMAQRYAAQLERPAFAEIAIALAADDIPAMEKLLADNPDRLPLLNRIDANIRLDRSREAQRLAFNGLDKNPDNEELQSRFTETALVNANYVEAGATSFRQSPLRFVESDLTLKQHVTEHLSVIIKEAIRNQHSDDLTQLINVPHQDRSLKLGLNYKTTNTDLLFEAGTRNAVKTFGQARFAGSWKELDALTWNAGLGLNQEATDSPQLRIGGMKDVASLGANWRIGTHDFIQGQVEASRYYAQDRTAIGSGTQFEIEAGHRFRIEYPDFTLRAVATRANYTVSGDAGTLFGHLSPDGTATVAEVMPASFTQAGLVFSFGMDLQENYTRAWRPFLEVGLLHDTREGWVRNARVGVAGSVLGNDHAMLYYTHDRSAQNGGSPASEFGVRYRWNF